MRIDQIEIEYKRRRELTLLPLASKLKSHLTELLTGYPRVDSVRSRAKAIDRFLEKARKTEGERPKYSDALNQMQDQIAARVVVFYLADVEEVSTHLKKILLRSKRG